MSEFERQDVLSHYKGPLQNHCRNTSKGIIKGKLYQLWLQMLKYANHYMNMEKRVTALFSQHWSGKNMQFPMLQSAFKRSPRRMLTLNFVGSTTPFKALSTFINMTTVSKSEDKTATNLTDADDFAGYASITKRLQISFASETHEFPLDWFDRCPVGKPRHSAVELLSPITLLCQQDKVDNVNALLNEKRK